MFMAIPAVCWLFIGVVFFILLCGLNIKLFYHLIQLNIDAREHVKMIKERTAKQYNKFIGLSPDELDQFLAKIYSFELELAAVSNISEKDPSAEEKVYETAKEAVLDYLGSETISAIDYYYGTGYVIRWCELRFRYLENTGILKQIIDKNANARTIYGNLNG